MKSDSNIKSVSLVSSALLRNGMTKPVIARVIDGCNFLITQNAIGCSQLYLTKKVCITRTNASQSASRLLLTSRSFLCFLQRLSWL